MSYTVNIKVQGVKVEILLKKNEADLDRSKLILIRTGMLMTYDMWNWNDDFTTTIDQNVLKLPEDAKGIKAGKTLS